MKVVHPHVRHGAVYHVNPSPGLALIKPRLGGGDGVDGEGAAVTGSGGSDVTVRVS